MKTDTWATSSEIDLSGLDETQLPQIVISDELEKHHFKE